MSRPQPEAADLSAALAALKLSNAADEAAVPVQSVHETRAPRETGGSVSSAVGRAVDWAVVVRLRRRSSEEITAAAEHWASENGRPMGAEDRRMMGRAVIRQVVRSHAERLVREGQALWANAYLRPVRASAMSKEVQARFLPASEYARAKTVDYSKMAAVQKAFSDRYLKEAQ